MKKQILTIIAIIIAGGLIALAIALPSKAEKEQKRSEYYKSEFIAGCTEDSSGMFNFCSCMYENLEDTLGVDGIEEFAYEYDATGVLPDGVMDIANSCSSFIE